MFILAHEFGHFALHNKLKIGQTTYESFEDSKVNFKTGKRYLENPKHWIEWQANQFASSLILPRVSILKWLYHTQDEKGIRKGKLYLNDQESNQRMFYDIVKHLAYIFNVSRTSVIYKLKEMNLIEENSRLKAIGELIREYKSEFFL